MGKKYENPPIVEALCEFRFNKNRWEVMYPCYIYEKLKSDYPESKQQLNLNFLSPPVGSIELENRIQFIKKDGKGIIQISENLLSIHILTPYTSWSEFFPEIKKIFQIYNNIVLPEKTNRIGLRYVNKIDFEGNSVKLEDYFNFYPFMGDKLPQRHGNFNLKVFIDYEGEKDFLKIEQQAITKGIIIDLDYFSTKFENDINSEEILSWIDKAHINLEGAFEGCITDKLREVFKEVKN